MKNLLSAKVTCISPFEMTVINKTKTKKYLAINEVSVLDKDKL